MKKFLMFAISMVTLSSVFAQTNNSRGNRDQSRDVFGQTNRPGTYNNMDDRNDDRWNTGVYNNKDDRNGGQWTSYDRDNQIQRINREFAYKIQAIKHDRYLNFREKTRRIRMLEIQRDDQIRSINERFSSYNTHYDNRPYMKNDGRR